MLLWYLGLELDAFVYPLPAEQAQEYSDNDISGRLNSIRCRLLEDSSESGRDIHLHDLHVKEFHGGAISPACLRTKSKFASAPSSFCISWMPVYPSCTKGAGRVGGSIGSVCTKFTHRPSFWEAVIYVLLASRSKVTRLELMQRLLPGRNYKSKLWNRHRQGQGEKKKRRGTRSTKPDLACAIS